MFETKLSNKKKMRTILFVAFVGLNLGVKVKVLPNSTFAVCGKDMLSNAISGCRLSTNMQPYKSLTSFQQIKKVKSIQLRVNRF